MRSKEALRLRILELCDTHNLTLNGLCAICGITQSTLNNLIRAYALRMRPLLRRFL